MGNPASCRGDCAKVKMIQMNQPLWTDVDAYTSRTLVRPDEALNAAIKRSEEAGLPAISVSASQGKMLMACWR